MKKWLLFLMLLSAVDAAAQVEEPQKEDGKTWSFSYLGHLGFQPGVKVGLEMPLMGKPSSASPEDMRTWIIRPQAAFFTNPGDDQNLLINVETGIRMPISGKNAYRIISFGLGYLNQSKLQSFSVNLGNGQTDNKQRVSDHSLLPTLNYEYGWATHRKMSWFSKLSIGRRLFASNEDTMLLFLELGVKLKLKKN